MATVSLASTTAEVNNKNVTTEEGAHTISGLFTFDRDPSAPFAVSSGSAVVTNLNADMVDGIHAADLGGLDAGDSPTITGTWTFSTNPVFAANAIPETAIADGSVLARLAANEQITGAWGIKAGASTVYAGLGGTLYSWITGQGNVGTGEDTLYSQAIAANTLSVNGQKLTFGGFGTWAANGNSKVVRVKFGATTILTATTTGSGGGFRFSGEIVRTGAATQVGGSSFFDHASSGGSGAAFGNYSAPAETLSNAITFTVTGEATSNDDIVLKHLTVRWEPAGN